MKLSKKIFIILSLLGLAGCGGDYKKNSLSKPLWMHRKNESTKNKSKKEVPPEAKRNPEYLTFDELNIAKNHYLSLGKPELAAKCVEEMLKKTSDIKSLQELRLEFADLHFETGHLEQASKLYTAYVGLYPGSENSDDVRKVYAHYQTILCRFYLNLSADRDQTKTHEVLIYAEDYLNQAKTDPQYQLYLADVQNIKSQCCQKLYESDLNIYNYYFNKGSFKACQVHLENMQKRFAPLLPERRPELLELECGVAEKLGQPELLALKRTELKERYPDQYTKMLVAHAESVQKKAIAQF